MSHGTVLERRALTAARRERARGRDAARLTLARELAVDARISIPPERGYTLVPPGELQAAAEVVNRTNEAVDAIGHEALMAGRTKFGFMARGFLPREAFDAGSPYLRLALDEDLVAATSAYLGVVPVLTEIDAWYSAHGKETPKSSQLWHLDHADTTQVKVWVHCSDVGPESGPLTVVEAAASDELAERVGYGFDKKRYRVPDERVREAVSPDAIVPLAGPKGTVALVDTSACFHFGSRVEEGAHPRRMVLIQYLTPYAFEFASDHREEAPFRRLAGPGSSELERLVLGSD